MPGPKKRKLTVKERKFTQEYVKTGNATKALEKAYDRSPDNKYNPQEAYSVKQRPVVQKEIARLLGLAGLDDANLIDHIREAMEAPVKDEKITWAEKMKYLRMALELKGHFEKTTSSNKEVWNFLQLFMQDGQEIPDGLPAEFLDSGSPEDSEDNRVHSELVAKRGKESPDGDGSGPSSV